MRRVLWYLLPVLVIPVMVLIMMIGIRTFYAPVQNLNPRTIPSIAELKTQYPHKGKLPAAVDLRRWAPKPGSQGQSGSCVAWAIGYTMLSWYATRAGDDTTFAPMYVYSQTHITKDPSGGGSTAQDTFNLLTTQGIATHDIYTQGDTNFTTKPTKAQKKQARTYRITGYTELYVSPEGNAGSDAKTAIQTVLASGNPVGLSIPVNKAFEKLDKYNYNWDVTDIREVDNRQGTNHYVAVMAYDNTGVWIENSWTTHWGRHGYAHLSWDFITEKSYEAEAIHGFATHG